MPDPARGRAIATDVDAELAPNSKSRIRVCHIVATTRGGTWLIDQLTRLRDDYGYEVTAVLNGPEGPLVDTLRARGIRCLAVDFDYSSLPQLPSLVMKTLALATLLRRERFDVVQTALWHSMLTGRLAAWLADVPVRLTMVAGPFHLDAPITRWIDGSTCWMETVLVGCCQHINDIYRQLGITDERLALIYYGPDESRFNPDATVRSDIRREYGWPDDTPLVAHVSWFYGRVGDNRWAPPNALGNAFKGHEDLIRATPLILREFPTAKILLVGQGWLEDGNRFREEMQALVSELDLKDSVIFTGYRPTVNDVILAADVAVQPSISEACGGTFESLLMERPTVGTRIGGIPDMVIDGETGVLVNPADPEDLARGICDLLRDPERAAALGKAGRQHVLRTATLSRTVADLDALYRRWLHSNNGHRTRGYRWWVSLIRLPLLVGVCAYLHLRLYAWEYHFFPKWQAGWRPWQPRAILLLPVDVALSLLPFMFRYRLYLYGTIARGYSIAAWQRTIRALFRSWRTLKANGQQAVSLTGRRFGRRRHVVRLERENLVRTPPIDRGNTPTSGADRTL